MSIYKLFGITNSSNDVKLANSSNGVKLMSSSTSLTWRQLIPKLSSTDKCFEFCWEYKLLPDRDRKNCVDCRDQSCVKLIRKNGDSNFPWQLTCTKCGKRTSVRKNTWFEKCKFPIGKGIILVSCWIRDYTLEETASETDLSANTICDYYVLCREVCYVIVTNSSVPIGGKDKVVEIDEIRIASPPRKRRIGRLTKNEAESVWLFSGIERGSRKFFIVNVYSREKATLVPLIKHYVLPGTKIITDGWKSYEALKSEGFNHEFVNHEVEFVSSDDVKAHKQNGERLWNSLKNIIKREGRRGEREDMYLFQYMYFNNLRMAGKTLPSEILPIFLRDIARVYPGYGLKGLKPMAFTRDGIVENVDSTETDTNQEDNTETDMHQEDNTETDMHQEDNTETDMHQEDNTETGMHQVGNTETDMHQEGNTETDMHREGNTN